MNTFRSPKNRYHATINFDRATKELGSVVTFTSNDIDTLLSLCSQQVAIAKVGATVKIIENVAQFPQFDWKDCKVVKMNKNGQLL